MSNPSKDAINDYVQDHEIDLLYEWLESDAGWDNFVSWFWSKTSDNAREAILNAFLADYKAQEVVEFNEYTCNEVTERLSAGNEEDPRNER